MKDYKELIDTLRRCVNSEKCGSCPLAKEPGCRKTLSLSAADAIEELMPKTARWVFGETLGHSWMKCSRCLVSQGGQTACYTYCPNCGARMEKDDERLQRTL